MATTYRTPGVYVEEISKFPPSVAQVETAIPAFVGYTEKAIKKGESLTNKPERITSLLDYVTLFGSAKAETTIAVTIDDTLVNGALDRNIVVSQPSSKSPYLMYYALQMYFANGGGPCYVVSVNDYDADGADIVNFKALADGLNLLKKEDEPTLLLFPDATALSEVDFYSLYQNALLQCNDMQDRFTIIDTYTSIDTEDDSKILRDRISLGKDYLKYGAAYYPYLETILDYNYDEEEVSLTHFSYNADAYALIKTNLALIESLATGLPSTVTGLFSYTTPGVTDGDVSGSISNVLFQMYDAAGFHLGGTFVTDDTRKTAFLGLAETLNDALGKLVDFKKSLNNEAEAAASAVAGENPAITSLIEAAQTAFNVDFEGAGKIEEVYANLLDLFTKMQNANTATKQNNLLNVNAVNYDAELRKLVDYTPLNTQTTVSDPTNAFTNLTTNLTALATEIKKVEGLDKNNGGLHGRRLSNVEDVDNAAYNAIKVEINAMPITLPPSSTIAGVYARVDGDRGVWKAPANVGVNYVVKPNLKVTHDEQRELNVHTTGKSINAIRTFTGKGILVWGARTLAGNDNEWRYVPVRRFFNMVEESVERATEQFVFEPNDANTWVKVRAMIENFLVLQWRAGALAGAKPEQAFYVRVGLGETMTAVDILNGTMNVEIGMAAVRPAEFIILKFSHKMQEA